MSHYLAPEKRRALKRLIASGVSRRGCTRALGIGMPTVIRYAKIWKLAPVCACGQPAGHRAWCAARLEFSPKRRGWLADQWGKRGRITAITEATDRADREARELGHVLGPFVWASSFCSGLAYALCRTCGKSAGISTTNNNVDIYGTALYDRCLTAAEREALKALAQEKREWRTAKRTLSEIKRRLRPHNSRTTGSSPGPTSRG